MKKLIFSLLFVVVAVLFMPSVARGEQEYHYYFPQVAMGGGTEYRDGFRVVNGWETGVIIKENAGIPTKVQVLLFGDKKSYKVQYPGENRLVDVVDIDSFYGVPSFSMELPPNGSVQAIISLPSPDIKVGWMVVRLTMEEAKFPVDVFLQYRYKVNGQVMGQATVNRVSPSKKFSFYARRYTGSDQDLSETGIAMASPGGPTTCTFTRREGRGGVLDSFNEVIPSQGHFSRFLREMGPSLNIINFEGSIDVSCDQFVIGTALQTTGDGSNFNFSTIPPGGRPF